MIMPKEWEVVEIQKLVKITTGNKDTQDSNEYGLYPFFVRSQTIERINSYSFDGEAILTAGDGVGVGKVFHHVNGKFDFHQRVYCLSHFDQNVDPKFLFEYFKTNFIKQVNKYSAKGSVDSVRFDMIAKMLMPLPPKSEQQKIATILSTLDRTIEATQKLIDKEKMLKKGLMADLLTHGIDEQGWIEKRLIYVVDKSDRYSFTGGPFGSDLKSSDYVEQGVRVLQLQNIGDGKFKNNDFVYTSEEKAEELKSCQIFPDEIIMSKMGDPVGRACLIPNIEPKYVMCSDGIRIAVNRKEYDNKFIYYTINHDTFRKSIERVALGSTRKRVGLTELKVLTFYVPSLPEQQKIAEILSAQDRKIETEEINLAKLQNLKKGLMGDLLSGDVRVKL